MTARREILLVDDDRAVRLGLASVLEASGYAVRTARDGLEALDLLAERKSDLVLLDVMMPRLDGFSACRRLRETDAHTPVLFLSALGDEENQLRGFGYGADDYIVKTLPEPILLARIAAALRRSDADRAAGDFALGCIRVEAEALRVRWPDGTRRPVSERECAMLRLFAANPDVVFSKDALETRFWGAASVASASLVRVAIYNLRAKLGPEADRLLAIRKVGYVWQGLRETANDSDRENGK